MDAEKFAAATDRIARERGLTLAGLAGELGISAQHVSDCRAGRRVPSRMLIVALRAVAAALPPLPEEVG